MDDAKVKDGVVREATPCSCGAPRSTSMVPADQSPVGKPLVVTLCMRCDGGIEWKAQA